MKVLRMQHRYHLLEVSEVTITSESNDVHFSYDSDGDDQSKAW